MTNPDMDRMCRVMDLLRKFDKEVPAQVLACFFYIVSRDNCHKTAMEEDLEMSNSSASRNMDRLTEQHRLNKAGMGLVVKQEDPTNRRRLQLRLSTEGEDLIKQIESILYD
jgi:DNA-binding MarR family transcriptional regulator